MIGIDTNIIVYAHRQDLPQHDKAKAIIEDFANGLRPWTIAWPSLYEFYRLVTHPRVFNKPSTRKNVMDLIMGLAKIPSLSILSHGPGHANLMKQLADEADVVGNIAFDVQIAAIFLEHGVDEVLTNDADFRRFRELRITNPFI